MTSINRREMLLGAGAVGMTLASNAIHAASDGLMTAADVHVNGYPTVEAVRWIGKRLEERTDGRLRIRVYYAGQLGREGDTVDLTRFGALDITRVNFAPLNNPFPLTQMFALPYVFNSVEHMRRAVDGEAGALVLKGFEARNLIGLAIYDAGSRSFYNVRRAIHEPKDLNGLKFRVPPSDIFLETVSALGGEPTPLPFGEVYSALQTHLIDGAENNWRSFQTSRHFEVARYISGSEHSYSPEALLMSRRTFDALSPADRDLVIATARESVPYMRGLWDRMEEEARQTVLQAGVHFNEVDRDAFHKAAAPVLEKYLAHGDLKKLHELVRAAA